MSSTGDITINGSNIMQVNQQTPPDNGAGVERGK
jgi:hypothetical protein